MGRRKGESFRKEKLTKDPRIPVRSLTFSPELIEEIQRRSRIAGISFSRWVETFMQIDLIMHPQG